MRIGTKVSIKATCNEYRTCMNGCVGYVKAAPITIDKVGVEIPGYFNGESDYGCFWFCPNDLNVIREPFKSEAPSSVSPLARVTTLRNEVLSMKDDPHPEVYFSEWKWCRNCRHCWRYITQEPCKECLFHPIGPDGPIHYEKETTYV